VSAVRSAWWIGSLLVCLGGATVFEIAGCDRGSPEVEVIKNPPPMPEDTYCVVSNEPSRPQYAVAYHGKTYFLCCKKCIRAFKADPARYADPDEPAH
jgi:YHS domain-containing protein